MFEVFKALDVAPAPDHVFHAREFEDPTFHVPVALPDGLHDLRQGDVVGDEAVGVDGDLVLFDETADAGHLGNAGNALHAQLDDIVLDGAQFGKVVTARLIDDGIGKTPAEARGVGAEYGIDIGGNLVLDRLEIFEDPASRPVDIGPLLEDDIDEGAAEEGKPPDGLDLGRRQQGGRNRVGDLVLDQIGAPARPFRVDDDLRVAQIGDGIQRRIPERPGTPDQGEGHNKEDYEFVAGAEFNDFGDHRGYCLPLQ